VLGAVEAKFWRSFSETAGHPEWIARQSETLPQHALITEVAAFFAGLQLTECEARFAGADCCVTPVLDLAEALHSTHHRERGVAREGPDGGLQALFPALIDGQPSATRAEFQVSEMKAKE
jgi:crotonobetainyl-CoA:carnitine CoA-transferase CaiB-like acyl-CoA transferase